MYISLSLSFRAIEASLSLSLPDAHVHITLIPTNTNVYGSEKGFVLFCDQRAPRYARVLLYLHPHTDFSKNTWIPR